MTLKNKEAIRKLYDLSGMILKKGEKIRELFGCDFFDSELLAIDDILFELLDVHEETGKRKGLNFEIDLKGEIGYYFHCFDYEEFEKALKENYVLEEDNEN